MNVEAIKFVHKVTQCGLGRAKEMLEQTSGDRFLAVRRLITDEQITEMESDVRSRTIITNTLAGPPTQDELDLIDYLRLPQN